ncbi:uncharacterized protein LOC111613663 isoform X1 [Centruroides sculpturatus]|uniref:uncharacterized protein LOC111613663 isoform X1 n=1 Tax=Centruroides sculpturatus TaxID=218467 RepID=UPI000C6D2D29|nr:uncharacterized protein LOC111613663 isoform X1 [Centruroides sculpturatus]
MQPATSNINRHTIQLYTTNMEANTQTSNLLLYRRIFYFSTYLVFLGVFSSITGIVMMTVYNPRFYDSFSMKQDSVRQVGEIVLAFGILFIVVSVICFCVVTIKTKKRTLNVNRWQRNSTYSVPLPDPSTDFVAHVFENDISGNPSYLFPTDRRVSPITIDDKPPCYYCVMQQIRPSECLNCKLVSSAR